jgi:hypothetical protein
MDVAQGGMPLGKRALAPTTPYFVYEFVFDGKAFYVGHTYHDVRTHRRLGLPEHKVTIPWRRIGKQQAEIEEKRLIRERRAQGCILANVDHNLQQASLDEVLQYLGVSLKQATSAHAIADFVKLLCKPRRNLSIFAPHFALAANMKSGFPSWRCECRYVRAVFRLVDRWAIKPHQHASSRRNPRPAHQPRLTAGVMRASDLNGSYLKAESVTT